MPPGRPQDASSPSWAPKGPKTPPSTLTQPTQWTSDPSTKDKVLPGPPKGQKRPQALSPSLHSGPATLPLKIKSFLAPQRAKNAPKHSHPAYTVDQRPFH